MFNDSLINRKYMVIGYQKITSFDPLFTPCWSIPKVIV